MNIKKLARNFWFWGLIALLGFLLFTCTQQARASTERRIHVWGSLSELTLSTENIPPEQNGVSILVWANGSSSELPVSWKGTMTTISLEDFPAGWESAMPIIDGGFDTLVIDANAPVEITSNPNYFAPKPQIQPTPSIVPTMPTAVPTATPSGPRQIEISGRLTDTLIFKANNISQEELNANSTMEVCTNNGCNTVNVVWTNGESSMNFSDNMVSASHNLPDYQYVVVDADAGVQVTSNPRYFASLKVQAPVQMRRFTISGSSDEEFVITAHGIQLSELAAASFQICTNSGCQTVAYSWSNDGVATIDLSQWEWVSFSINLPDYIWEIIEGTPVDQTTDPRWLQPKNDEKKIFLPIIAR